MSTAYLHVHLKEHYCIFILGCAAILLQSKPFCIYTHNGFLSLLLVSSSSICSSNQLTNSLQLAIIWSNLCKASLDGAEVSGVR